MSTALLQELHQEVRRIYIAGSELAAGDFRLKRLLPQFQQLGERAAVFKRLGEGITSLVEPGAGDEVPAAVRLQELTLLLESVLYTQGVSTPDEAPGELRSRNFTLDTQLPYRKLAAVRQALTTTGSGRYEIVIEAFKDGMFRDLRLLPLAIAALNDPYSEIAEYAMTTILPSYGPPITGYLIETLNLAGGKSEVRKLKAIAKAGGTEVAEEIFKAAEDGSDDIRAAAIECLGGHDAYLPFLLEWSKDKKKVIREAAYKALVTSGLSQGEDRLYEAFAGKKDRELVADALAYSSSTPLMERLSALYLQELREAPQKNEDKKKTEQVWNSIRPFTTVLFGQQNPQLDELYSYVIQDHGRFASLGFTIVINEAARYKQNAATEAAFEELRQLEKLDTRYFPYLFRAAQQLMSAEELYKQFGGTLMNKLKAVVTKDSAQRNKLLMDTIKEQVMHAEEIWYDAAWDPQRDRQYRETAMLAPDKIAAAWDPRWLDLFIHRDVPELVCAFARPKHAEARSYLLNKLSEQKDFQRNLRNHDVLPNLFTGLARSGMPDPELHELLISVLENGKSYLPYRFDYFLFQHMLKFPASYHSRLEALVPNQRYYESRAQLEYVIHYLKGQA
ncbi:HEAT repeat domain-containing protein [Paenibacillus graminis]|uniref:HEAT repeat domain-containing protein n=1 Tax=Paenibacillus graminis TaxID=189425 RepID=UPI002DBDDFDD|nr:HEAT repeat domain-containing protein [Paenibacillus graminis]MEC0171830.1 HEAT repeat domain-containing protein [Paenibacillus graminis]